MYKILLLHFLLIQTSSSACSTRCQEGYYVARECTDKMDIDCQRTYILYNFFPFFNLDKEYILFH